MNGAQTQQGSVIDPVFETDRRSSGSGPRPGGEERRGGAERRDSRGSGRRLRTGFDALAAAPVPVRVVREPDAPRPLALLARRLGAFNFTDSGLAVIADAVVILVLFAVTARFASLGGEPTVGLAGPAAWISALVMPLVNLANGGYRLPTRLPGADLSRFGRFFINSVLMSWTLIVAATFVDLDLALPQLFVVSVLTPPLILAARWALEWRPSRQPQRILILGSGYVADRAAELMQRSAAHEVVGHVDDGAASTVGTLPRLGRTRDLPKLLDQLRVDRVLVAFSPTSDRELMTIIRQCDAKAVEIDIVPRLFEFTGLEPCVMALGDLPIVHVRAVRAQLFPRLMKRAFDIVLAGIALIAISPIFAAVALAIVLDDGRPVFYRQRRVGRGGELFDILKFRSMSTGAEQQDAERIAALEEGMIDIGTAVAGTKQVGDPRVTRVGAFIRKTSLDELPQFWNVIRGDMSLVGPRPLRPFEVEQLRAWQLVRQDVRPGITGLWQVLGRSNVGWDERMQLDYAYVRHWSPAKDLRILAETLPVILRAEGAH